MKIKVINLFITIAIFIILIFCLLDKNQKTTKTKLSFNLMDGVKNETNDFVVVELTPEMVTNTIRTLHFLSEEENNATTLNYVSPPATSILPNDAWVAIF